MQNVDLDKIKRYTNNAIDNVEKSQEELTKNIINLRKIKMLKFYIVKGKIKEWKNYKRKIFRICKRI